MIPFAFYFIDVSCFLLTTTISLCTHLYTFSNANVNRLIRYSQDGVHTRSPNHPPRSLTSSPFGLTFLAYVLTVQHLLPTCSPV